jgi:hypothetical protein
MEHVGRDPLHAPVHFVSFQPLAADALTTIGRPRRTWNVWTQGNSRQVNEPLPVTRTVPRPVTLTFSGTVPGRPAAEAPAVATNTKRAPAAITETTKR